MLKKVAKIGLVDCDNTLSDWVGWVGKRLDRDPINPNAFTLEEMYGLSSDQALKLVMDPAGYSSTRLRPIPHSSRVLNNLYEAGYCLWYISAAPIAWVTHRRIWMGRNKFPLIENGHPNTMLLHLDNRANKIEWILEHGREAWFIIDDQIDYLDAAATAGIPNRFLLNALHNLNIFTMDHTRVSKWSEIQRALV